MIIFLNQFENLDTKFNPWRKRRKKCENKSWMVDYSHAKKHFFSPSKVELSFPYSDGV